MKVQRVLNLLQLPKKLEAMIVASDPRSVIVIDEIQKVPQLLDEVQRLIFLLTGSSARKLRQGQATLLTGRAWQANLFPS